ncbi:HD-GYP domain-containing protein [Segeticoccus rhizosphaerae]|uniref:HD-GYP domain-containing protein n=1 Tax=Segeticoccus rhizosphaerae TaxID=1104777 RepID=UPI0010BF7925|nr:MULTISPECIES: HD domain-containing phosphohydrolase [Intrasporangiaceae]
MMGGATRADRALGAVAAAVLVTAAIFSVPAWGRLTGTSVFVIVAFLVAIAVGESLRVSLLDVRETPPIAMAASLAFAMTTEAPKDHRAVFGAAVVTLVTAAGMAVGAAALAVARRRPVSLTSLAIGLIGTSLVAVLFREVPIFEGMTALDKQFEWARTRWITALCMLAASALGLVLQLALLAAVRASHEHAPLGRALVDEASALAPLYSALSATAALVALAELPLGIVAIPLFLLPLLLLQFALRRHSVIRATFRQTVRSLARLTELGGYTAAGHSRRVAALCVAIGRDVGLSEREVLELEYAALLHDIGQVSLTEPIPRGATVLVAPGDQRRIALDGARIVRQTGELDNVARIMETQAIRYRQVRELGQDLPMASRIIKVANAFDDLAEGASEGPRAAAAIERIQLGLGYEYDPAVVDALARALERGVANA